MRFEFVPVPTVKPELCEEYTRHAETLGLPHVQRAGNVAVVGGGASLADHLDELREWNGPIWAINQTFNWLKDQGIESTLVTSDPKDQPWLEVGPGDYALVAKHGCPELFERLKAAHVTTYTLGPADVICGPTTATALPSLALYLGNRSVTFFGCDSSYSADAAYAYERELPKDLITVLCGGEVYITKPEFMIQADYLAAMCREIPEFHKNRSGGLLEAMIEHGERVCIAAPFMEVA